MDNFSGFESSDPVIEPAIEPAIEPVHLFVRQIRRRLNWHRMLRCGLGSVATGAAVMLCVATGYVWAGYAVPVIAWPVAAAGCAVVTLVAWLMVRIGDDEAAHFVDTNFELKDSVRSCRNFSLAGKTGGFYSLQAIQTQAGVAGKSCESIRYGPSYRLAGLAGLMLLIAVVLGFKGTDPVVLDRIGQENATAAMTSKVNRELREMIDGLERSIDDENEKKLVDPNKLREWVDQLEETRDLREAMRQYARLERKINQAAEAIQQKKEEQLLDLAAEELKKQDETRDLGDTLKQKKYDQAAKKLGELDPEKKASESDANKKLSEKKKELARLRAAANRMADAARRSANQPDQKGNQKNSPNAPDAEGKDRANNAADRNRKKQAQQADGQPDKAGNPQQQPGDIDQDGELTEMLEDLEEGVEELDQAIQEAEMQEGQAGEEEDGEKRMAASQNRVQGDLERLQKKLMKMARQRSAQSRLRQLGAKAGLAAENAAQNGGGKSGSHADNSSGTGGKEPGTGTSDAQREGADNVDVKGWQSALKGIKGEGPSLTKIESADDGTGVSGRTGEAKQREFQRQFESFVERADIPEDLRNGVKNYFTQIHEPSEPLPDSDGDETGK